ncbi:MAG: T9SS type A sorting domain-containing protein [Candidatus Kapaibacterium sp.]
MRFTFTVLCALCVYLAVSFAQPSTVKLLSPAGGEAYKAGTSQTLRWDTTGTLGSRFMFQFATSQNGPWTNISLPKGIVNVLDSTVIPSGQAGGRGAYNFGFRVPAMQTTTGYVRMVLVNSDGSYNMNVTSMNSTPFTITQATPTKVDSTITGTINGTVTLSNTKIYGLEGFVYVLSGATLRIEPGTIVVGDLPGVNSALIINRGGKIYAQGTPQKPIIFTSRATQGQRSMGDWGGILVCGKARINNPGGESIMEGFPDDLVNARYGGSDDEDSSGVMSYCRVEFGGIALFPNQEINGLTIAAVGRRTKLDHIQVSYAGDDSYEFFGGTVDTKYLISYGGIDDDFDTDNGYSGRNQFLLAKRFRQVADQSSSQIFESDNDASGSRNEPLTRALYSNVTAIGAVADTSWIGGSGDNQYNRLYTAAAMIRRNSRISICNSVFTGFPAAVEFGGPNPGFSADAASRDSLQIRSNTYIGIKANWRNTVPAGTTGFSANWLTDANNGNVIVNQSGNVESYNGIANSFVEGTNAFNPIPKSDATYIGTQANPTTTFKKRGSVAIDDPYFQQVYYRGAFSPDVTNRWDLPWAEYDPVNAEYKPQTPPAPFKCKLLSPVGGEKFKAGTSQTLKWDTASAMGKKFVFQFGTSQSGPWTNLPLPGKNTYVLDSTTIPSGKVGGHGAYNFGFRVPATPTTSGYVRMVLMNNDGTLDETNTSTNATPFTITQAAATQVDSTLSGNIASTITLSNKKIYGLQGMVYVQSGATLRIEPGTIVVGDAPGVNSALVINRGAKIYAVGTPKLPIIFTSRATQGQRAMGDWGGILICGNARINNPGGVSIMEGFPDDVTNARYGGTDDEDSSGVMSYCRVEFGGIALFPNQEINGLTLAAVGRKTKLDHIQVSYAGDDSYEFFGGTVDTKYMIAYGGIDDDFDTDNGYSGRNQFLLGKRFRQVADQSTSQTFESDNDASGSRNEPLTRAVYSNVTAIGAVADTSWTPGSGDNNQYNRLFGSAAMIRRNSRISILNSVFAGFPAAVEFGGPNPGFSADAASRDSLQLRNNTYIGIKANWRNAVPAGTTSFAANWLTDAANGNTIINQSGSLDNYDGLTNVFVEGTNQFNPVPKMDAPFVGTEATPTSTFTKRGSVGIDDPYFQHVYYRGAFSPDVTNRWDAPWAEYDPVNAEYKAQTETSSVEEVVSPVNDAKAFPNPASGVVTVRYTLNTDAVVSLRFCDALGVVASTFAELVPQQSGVYEFRINTQDVANGVYFVRVVTERGTTTIPLSVVH